MKILMVGPGLMPIPSNGWGAVETVVWNQKLNLEKLGHTVTILNERGLVEAIKAMPWKYDYVHLHYDEYAGMWNRLSKIFNFKLIVTTHYGYSAYPERWDISYKKVFKNLIKSKALLVLSNEIKMIFQQKGFKNWIEVLPNGVDNDLMKYNPSGNNRAICLGKIEKRKMQAKLSTLLSSSSIKCDFVGPIVDDKFKVDNVNTFYLGEWNRDDVFNKLPNYSTLILASEGEAHALVILEALSCGLSVVVTEEASANLDRNLPWVYICNFNDNTFLESIEKALKYNFQYRDTIRKYAIENFNWLTICKRYEGLITKYLRG